MYKPIIKIMENLTQYKPEILKIFKRFLDGEINTISDLTIELYLVEEKIKSENVAPNENSSLWIRYFKGYTLATTISDIYNDLNSPTNYVYTINCISIAVESNELEVYYS